MADNLTNTAEHRTLNWLTGNATVPPMLPLQLRLLRTLGTDTTPGIEVTGGSYTPQTIAFAAAEAGQAISSHDVAFYEMPATTVVGYEIWDAAGIRWWHGAASETRQIAAGEPYEIYAGQLVLTVT